MSSAYYRCNKPCDAVHGAVGLRVCNVLEMITIVVDEERVVRVLLRVPLVDLREDKVRLLDKLGGWVKVGSDVRGEGSKVERHVVMLVCGFLGLGHWWCCCYEEWMRMNDIDVRPRHFIALRATTPGELSAGYLQTHFPVRLTDVNARDLRDHLSD